MILTASMLAVLTPAATAAAVGTSSPSSLDTAHSVSGCGSLTRVYTPASGQSLAPPTPVIPRTEATVWNYAAKRHVRWLSSLTCKQVPRRLRYLPAPRAISAANSSNNWSGYSLVDSVSNFVEGFWTVPAVTGNGQNDYSSVWVGMGGGPGSTPGELVQDGTESDISASGATRYFFWIEDFPAQPEQMVTNLVPAPGDSVATATSWDPASGNTEFTLCDWTQNACVDGTEATRTPGSSVEWIIERPTVGGSLPSLANYGTMTLTNCNFGELNNPNLIAAGDGNPTGIFMWADQPGQSDELSAPDPMVSSTEFTALWINFH